MPDNLSPDALLRRKVLAEAFKAKGYPITDKTLATQAVRGGGPPFCKFGRAVLYRWGDALAWAEGKLSGPRSSTSEVPPAATIRAPKSQAAHAGSSGHVDTVETFAAI